MAMISSTHRLPREFSNAAAAPWNWVAMVSGSSRVARAWMRDGKPLGQADRFSVMG
jgi:hypothetical protein